LGITAQKALMKWKRVDGICGTGGSRIKGNGKLGNLPVAVVFCASICNVFV